MPFVRAVVKVVLKTERNFEETFALFPQSLLSIDNVLWRNVIWNSEKKTMIVNNQPLTERLMLYYLDKNLLTAKELTGIISDLKAVKMLTDTQDVYDLLNDAISTADET